MFLQKVNHGCSRVNSEHLSEEDGIEVFRVLLEKLEHSAVPLPQQNREDVVVAL